MTSLALFDLDGTLVDRRAAYEAAVAALCSRYGYGPEIEAWLVAALAERAAPEDFEEMRKAFALAATGVELWQAYVEQIAAAALCRPAVLEALGELRATGWTIGVVTNGSAEIQRAKLHAAGIHALIDGVAVSGDIDIRKPDRELFALAAQRCGAELGGNVWVVGDNPHTDIAGAHHAGLHSIWLRGRPWPAGLVPPDHTVDDVLDAIRILQRENAR